MQDENSWIVDFLLSLGADVNARNDNDCTDFSTVNVRLIRKHFHNSLEKLKLKTRTAFVSLCVKDVSVHQKIWLKNVLTLMQTYSNNVTEIFFVKSTLLNLT